MTGLIPFNRRTNNPLSIGNDAFWGALDDFFSNDWRPVRNLAGDTFKIDVEETDSDYKINAELPGVNKDEVKLDFTEGRLAISVERNENINEENKNYIHRETKRSSMMRSVYLADGVTDNIKAKLENGLLSISVPKKEKVTSSHKIEIE